MALDPFPEPWRRCLRARCRCGADASCDRISGPGVPRRGWHHQDQPRFVRCPERITAGEYGLGRRRLDLGIDGHLYVRALVSQGVPAADGQPDFSDRWIPAEFYERPRQILERHFPDLVGAPINETRACHYESSVDLNFIVDTHPELDNVWLAGGGVVRGIQVWASPGRVHRPPRSGGRGRP